MFLNDHRDSHTAGKGQSWGLIQLYSVCSVTFTGNSSQCLGSAWTMWRMSPGAALGLRSPGPGGACSVHPVPLLPSLWHCTGRVVDGQYICVESVLTEQSSCQRPSRLPTWQLLEKPRQETQFYFFPMATPMAVGLSQAHGKFTGDIRALWQDP